MGKINRAWHESHRMPKNPTLVQRMDWHIEHIKNCNCREMPDSIKKAIADKKNKMKIIFSIFIAFILCVNIHAQKQKVIFDCDFGDDIDDAFALGMLLCNQDRLDILGITTCYGRTEDRARTVLKMLYQTGQDKIPVFIGRNTSTSNERANWYADQFYWAKGFDKLKPQAQPAADFIIQSLNKYPGEVIVITVGPVMNMADVIAKDAGALKKAKKVYSMFGSFYIGYNASPTINAEWNVKADPVAAKKFVDSGADIVYAGLDVTTMIKLNKANRDLLLQRQSPLTNALMGLYTLWNAETPTLFDPAAIGMILYPDLFKTKKVAIHVDDIGNTILEEGKNPNAEIGVYVNANDFLNRLMKTYLQQNLER